MTSKAPIEIVTSPKKLIQLLKERDAEIASLKLQLLAAT
jgi:hypothetical protein